MFMFLCIFITMFIHFYAMHIHFYAYSLSRIFISMHIHFYAYSLQCIFISIDIHPDAYSHRSVYLSYSLSHTQGRYTQTKDRQTQTDTHSHTATSIRPQKILQDRLPIIRDYRLSGWFYNKLYDCRIVSRCYNSYRQAVLYEATLWQVQVVL